ncbi:MULTISPECIES: hypothetical protein [Terrabacteria group]|uniref:hypothetical protein n=1 Tax=Bacillati TaxID=1783272 RepID=UPI001C6F420C|nr:MULTISPECIES: hypothetical protein [Terrabacteria group]MBW9213021.1 hypothetical protein [Trueperella sp. zg.1013]
MQKSFFALKRRQKRNGGSIYAKRILPLTEVSEDDLLNMVEKKENLKEEVKKIEETVPKSEVKKEEPNKGRKQRQRCLYFF